MNTKTNPASGEAKQKVSETRSLFYRGAINEIHGEPGVGKSNLGTAAVIAVALAGGSACTAKGVIL